ncbi:hypothetical protein CEXT_96871 [Caerostris extrusa]|uniref:Uncharacterized protein n=1 Tax=Caerostris extrusa TaxID=172846 RepID=A0AAV4NPX6_CAEEX|nr:hypothetical protein CEXT_96871 [Caerostris extrusa]
MILEKKGTGRITPLVRDQPLRRFSGMENGERERSRRSLRERGWFSNEECPDCIPHATDTFWSLLRRSPSYPPRRPIGEMGWRDVTTCGTRTS